MSVTLKVNARNDLHLPAAVLRALNLGRDRLVKAEVRGHALVVFPVDLEPRYSLRELEGLDRLHTDEKAKGWIRLESPRDIDRLLSGRVSP